MARLLHRKRLSLPNTRSKPLKRLPTSASCRGRAAASCVETGPSDNVLSDTMPRVLFPDAERAATSPPLTQVQATEQIRVFAGTHHGSGSCDESLPSLSSSVRSLLNADEAALMLDAQVALLKPACSASAAQTLDLGPIVLAATTCFQIACKFLECGAPRLTDLAHLASKINGSSPRFSNLQLMNAEKAVLATLDWNILMTESVNHVEDILDSMGSVCRDRHSRIATLFDAFSCLETATESCGAVRLARLQGFETLALLSNSFPEVLGETWTHASLLWHEYLIRCCAVLQPKGAIGVS